MNHKNKNQQFIDWVKEYWGLTVVMLPESCMLEEDGYEKGDEDAPFFFSDVPVQSSRKERGEDCTGAYASSVDGGRNQ